MADEVQTFVAPVKVLSNATTPLAYIPASWGAITILKAYAIGGTANAAPGLDLLTLSTAGTPAVNGTIAAGGTLTLNVGAAVEFTAAVGQVVNPGTTGIWIGVRENNVATTVTGGAIAIAYLAGK